MAGRWQRQNLQTDLLDNAPRSRGRHTRYVSLDLAGGRFVRPRRAYARAHQLCLAKLTKSRTSVRPCSRRSPKNFLQMPPHMSCCMCRNGHANCNWAVILLDELILEPPPRPPQQSMAQLARRCEREMEKDANATIGLAPSLPPSLRREWSWLERSVIRLVVQLASNESKRAVRTSARPVSTAHEIRTRRARRFFEYCLSSSRFLEMGWSKLTFWKRSIGASNFCFQGCRQSHGSSVHSSAAATVRNEGHASGTSVRFYRLRSKTNSSFRPTIISSKVIASTVLGSTIFKSTQNYNNQNCFYTNNVYRIYAYRYLQTQEMGLQD